MSKTHENSVGRLSDHILAVVWFPDKVFGHGREGTSFGPSAFPGRGE